METNVSGGQYCPEPNKDGDAVKIQQPLLLQHEQGNQAVRSELSLSHNDCPNDNIADMEVDESKSDKTEYDKTDYNADTDTIADDDDDQNSTVQQCDINEQANGEEDDINLSGDDDSIFAAAASLLVAERKQ